MEGIIYKIQPYKEHARLLFLYTPKGKITLIAQGSQKINHPMRVLSQYLTQIEFKEQNKSFYTLQDAKIIDDFEVIKQDFKKTKQAALILEMIDHLIFDEADHQSIYLEVTEALHAEDIFLSALSFSVKILKPLGYELNLKPDGRKVLGISIDTGSLVYEHTNDVVDLSIKASIYMLKLLMVPYAKLEPIPEEYIEDIKHFILKYYQYHLQTTLKNLQ